MATTATNDHAGADIAPDSIHPVGARTARDATVLKTTRRANFNLRGIARSARSYSGVFLLLAASVAQAQFSSEITAGITHTDNVALETENEDSELIYSLEPSFQFLKESGRLTADVNYRLQALRYRDLGETDIYHQYDANLRAALVPESFFFDLGASRSQSIVDPDQTIPISNLPISSNRQDRDEYYAGPSFQYALGSSIAARGSYRHTWQEYSELEARGNQQGEAAFSLDNYRNQQGLAWALRYDWQRTEWDLGIPWEYQQAAAELGFWVGANTRLFGSGGMESAWDQPFDPSMEDSFWEAGFFHQVGERLSAEFAVGERTFGSSWRGDLNLQFRRGSTSFSYSETPTTQGREGIGRGAFDSPLLPDDFLSRPGSTERFILKRLEWALNLEFRRSGLSLYLYDSDRTDRTEADGTPLADERQRGASLELQYRLGPRTDLRMGGSWLERDRDESGTSELRRASLAADYRLGQRTTLTFTYAYTEEDGDALFTLRDYVANTVSLFVTRAL